MPSLRPTAPSMRVFQIPRCVRPQLQRPTRRSRIFSTKAEPQIPTIPVISTCPPPTCPCSTTPTDLDIDRMSPLLHTAPAYAHHVVVNTGKADWASRIEDEEEGGIGEVVKGLRGEVKKDPFTNVIISLSSFPTAPSSTTLSIFPSSTRLTLPHPVTPSTYAALVSAHLPPRSRPEHPFAPPPSTSSTTSASAASPSTVTLPSATPITRPTVLICSHNTRDTRCGTVGPLLASAFKADFARRGWDADVGMVSHIGGHKFAGNVVVYIPPSYKLSGDGEGFSPLAGCGIWYGRVGVEHVEGLVEETVGGGRVVGELLRGGIMSGGEVLSRVLEGQVKGGQEQEGKGLKLRPRARR